MEQIVVGAQMRDHESLVQQLIDDRFASRLRSGDVDLWGPAGRADASERLGWIDVFARADDLIREAEELRQAFHEQGCDRVVLSGMGGSSLAPESITHHDGVPLVVLDSTHPEQVRSALTELQRTVLVVSSKSGSTVETRSHLAAFEVAFRDAEIDPATRIVVVTDPGSQLETDAREAGYRVFLADPNVGGRYSALTAFGLVPSVLAGASGARLVAEARNMWDRVTADSPENPALQLGAVLAAQLPEAYTFGVTTADQRLELLGAWVEQLIAESTGKQERGVLPIHLPTDSPEARLAQSGGHLPPHMYLACLTSAGADAGADAGAAGALAAADAADFRASESATAGASAAFDRGSEQVHARSIEVTGALGAQFLIWSVATVALCRLIGVNPFDQPDVESAKAAAREALADASEDAVPSAEPSAAPSRDGLNPAEQLRDAVTGENYIAVQAYADESFAVEAAELRNVLFDVFRVPVSLGVGPRFLHSTGQLHKGGPKVGVFVQVVDEGVAELNIPGTEYGFAALMRAQASGDRDVLVGQGRPVVTIGRDAVGRLIEDLRALKESRLAH